MGYKLHTRHAKVGKREVYGTHGICHRRICSLINVSTMTLANIKHCLLARPTRWVVLCGLLLSLAVTYVTDIWRIEVFFDKNSHQIVNLSPTSMKGMIPETNNTKEDPMTNVLRPPPAQIHIADAIPNIRNISNGEWDEDKLRREWDEKLAKNDSFDFLDGIIRSIAPPLKPSNVTKEPKGASLETATNKLPIKVPSNTNQTLPVNKLNERSKAALEQIISKLPSFHAEDVNCAALIAGNKKAVAEAGKYRSKNPKVIIPDYHYISAAKNCPKFRSDRRYISEPLTKEEEDFPIAYSILIFKEIEQFERLLRAIYHPQNYYCIHVDIKSDKDVKKATKAIANCFPNVFISSKSYDVEWGAYSVLEPELQCMKELWKYKKWKYFINLTGQEFPLKTNLDLVKILKVYNGANNMEGTVKRRNVDRTVYIHNGFFPTDKKLGPKPVNVTLTKGSVHVTASRAFVNSVLHDSDILKFREWVKESGVPDETFFSSLNYSPQLGIPGAYKGDPETDTNKNLFITRYKNWGVYPFNYPCSGQRVRMICVFAIGDLPILAERKELFANKFYLDYSPTTLDCMEELQLNRTRDEVLGKRHFDTSFYQELDFVKNHV